MKVSVIAVSLITISILLGCSGKNTKNSLIDKDLRGQIKTLTNYSYYAVVDKSGKIIKGQINSCDSVLFDKGGNQTKRYSSISLGSNKKPDSTIYKYTANENLAEKIEYNSEGNVESKETTEYDNKGYKIKKECFILFDSIKYVEVYKNDKNGKEVEMNRHRTSGRFMMKMIKKYDNDDNIIEESNYDSRDSLSDRHTYRYNNKKEMIEDIYRDKSMGINQTFTFKYENYDKNGNWIRRITYLNNSPDLLMERKIEYY